MKQLIFFLEEVSAEAMLKELLPRILPADIAFRCVAFEGKQHLEKSITRQLRANSRPGVRCIVMRDQDSADCMTVKQRLVELCNIAKASDTLVRIACRELESWYLADLSAVERGLKLTNLSKLQNKKKYRNPDKLGSPSKELKKLTRDRYQKIAGSRAIGAQLDLSNHRSRSFMCFVEGVRRVASTLDDQDNRR